MMKREKYKIVRNAQLKNRLNNEVIVGSILNEQSIEGKMYWVFAPDNRPNAKLLFSKDAYFLMRK